MDDQKNVYVADTCNYSIRQIDAQGTVTTFAGHAMGSADGTGGPTGTAQFNTPTGLAFDGSGNLIVADFYNNLIRRVDPSGNVTTIAGNGVQGYRDGDPSQAEFDQPYAVALDATGNIYVSDFTGNRIRKISF